MLIEIIERLREAATDKSLECLKILITCKFVNFTSVSQVNLPKDVSMNSKPNYHIQQMCLLFFVSFLIFIVDFAFVTFELK